MKIKIEAEDLAPIFEKYYKDKGIDVTRAAIFLKKNEYSQVVFSHIEVTIKD